MPATANIIMFCDEAECVGAINFNWSELSLVVLSEGGGGPVSQ